MNTDVLLDKINKFKEAKDNEINNKKNAEIAQIEDYKKQISLLSNRITELVKLGNAMKQASYIIKQTPSYTESSNILADFNNYRIKNNTTTISFMCGFKRENRPNTDEDRKLYNTVVGIGNYYKANYSDRDICLYVYPDGTVERLVETYDCTHGSYYTPDSSYPINSKILLQFLTEFDNFEKAVKDYLISLEA